MLIFQTSPLCNIFDKISKFFRNRCQPLHKELIFGQFYQDFGEIHASLSTKGWHLKFKKRLLTGTIPVNNSLLTGTVPVNNFLLTGTVPVDKSLLTGTRSLSIIPYWQGPLINICCFISTLNLDCLQKINDRSLHSFLNLSLLSPISLPPWPLHNCHSIVGIRLALIKKLFLAPT